MYTWNNAVSGYSKGIELEVKKSLIQNLSAGANVTWVNSSTELPLGTDTVHTYKRPMYGQAPFVVNGLLDYTVKPLGLSLTLSYNVQGPKIAYISTYDIYELSRHLVDFKMGKKLGEHFGVEFKIRNLLNAPVNYSYKSAENKKYYTHYTYSYGTSYVFSIMYQL
jgi:outer membrane receptor protein involved in Fe transport